MASLDMLSVGEIEEKLDDLQEEEVVVGQESYKRFGKDEVVTFDIHFSYHNILELSENEVMLLQDVAEVPLTLRYVDSFGGEGDGDQYWVVFSLSDGESTRFFKKDGYYASFDGGYLDGDLYEVQPAEKTITVYKEVGR